MSRPRLSAGISSAGTTRGSGSRSPDGNAVSTTMSVGSRICTPDSCGPLEVGPAGVELVLLEQALADLVALGLEEGEDHAAADQQLVGLAEQVVDHAELVGDLRAAEHHDVRPRGVDGEPAQHVDLARPRGHPWLTGSRSATSYTEACLRCTTPKPSETKRVGEVGQLRRRTTPRTSSSLLVSPALKRTFSSTATWPSLERRDGLGRAVPHRVGGEGDVVAEQLAEPLGHRPQRVLRVRARPWAGRGGRPRRRGRPGRRAP